MSRLLPCLGGSVYGADRGKAGTEVRDRGCFAAHTRSGMHPFEKTVCLQECGDVGAEFTPTTPSDEFYTEAILCVFPASLLMLSDPEDIIFPF